MKYLASFLFCFLLSSVLYGQEFANTPSTGIQIHTKPLNELSPMERIEDTLVYLADSMYYSQVDDNRIGGNEEFIRVLKRFLRTPGSFGADLKKLQEKIVILQAPDNQFRIYNWEISRGPAERRYYGVIQSADGSLYPLIDVSDQIVRGAEDSIFTNQRWYGNLFYNILMKETKGQKLYFLLGWNGLTLNSERKIMDVMYADENGKWVFGKPVFQMLDRGKAKECKRVLVEYEKGSKVALNLEKSNGQIIFDHCESQIGDPAKKYTYVPDGTYDGLKWNGSRWVMSENVVPITILKDGEAPIEKVQK
jgi:hypothetical protein